MKQITTRGLRLSATLRLSAGLRLSAALLAMGFVSLQTTSAVHAQLGVSAKGAKTVRLSDNVGKNQFTWTSEAPLEKIVGSAEGVTGQFTLDPSNLAGIRGTISAQVSTMKTGNATRDGHLKSGQWLDADKHPTISYQIASVSDVKVSGNSATGTAHGRFTLHGVSKELAVPFKVTYLDASEKTKARASGDLIMLNADFHLGLKDFDVAGGKGMIGSKVGETITISAQLFGATEG